MERRLQPARAALCAAHVVNYIHPHDGAAPVIDRSWGPEIPDIDRTLGDIDRSWESEILVVLVTIPYRFV